mmetsp:Transcript_24539/g.58182  ORF Transcript_24539/g.58182 Transcript_24539/m.58182 type:complete len:202 (+) Transcript_24539:1019-1624(+)
MQPMAVFPAVQVWRTRGAATSVSTVPGRTGALGRRARSHAEVAQRNEAVPSRRRNREVDSALELAWRTRPATMRSVLWIASSPPGLLGPAASRTAKALRCGTEMLHRKLPLEAGPATPSRLKSPTSRAESPSRSDSAPTSVWIASGVTGRRGAIAVRRARVAPTRETERLQCRQMVAASSARAMSPRLVSAPTRSHARLTV